MEKEALKTLEYTKITAMLEERAGSVLGKERAAALLPVSDFDEVQERMQQTAEAAAVYRMTAPPLGGIRSDGRARRSRPPHPGSYAQSKPNQSLIG